MLVGLGRQLEVYSRIIQNFGRSLGVFSRSCFGMRPQVRGSPHVRRFLFRFLIFNCDLGFFVDIFYRFYQKISPSLYLELEKNISSFSDF